MREAFPEPTTERLLDLIEHVYATGEPVRGTEVPRSIRTPDGSLDRAFFNFMYQPLPMRTAQIDSVVSFAVDVTEQVERASVRSRLTAACARARRATAASSIRAPRASGASSWPSPSRSSCPRKSRSTAFYRARYLAECNDAMARMYGYEHGEAARRRRLGELLVREDPRNTGYLRAFIANGYRLEGAESHEARPDGRPRVFRNSLVGMRRGRRLRRAWGTQRDVTAEVEAREQAEAGNRAKDEFLAMLGHELRNPLVADPDRARADDSCSDAEAFAKERAIIERQVKHVVRLVDDLLDVSRITRGKVDARTARGSSSPRWSRSAIELIEPAARAARAPARRSTCRAGLSSTATRCGWRRCSRTC